MEVILLRDVAKVGRKCTIVTVSEGYALNFLIPKGLARAATASAIRELESSKAKQDESRANEEKKVAEAISNLKGKTVTIHTNLNEQGHVFAAIKPEDIATAIYDQCGVSLPREALIMTDSLREGGTHTIALEGGGMKGEMTLAIVQK